MAIYNQIGAAYNLTRKADPQIVERMLAHLKPIPQGQYLDLACGTGNYTLAYHRAGLQMSGVDQSELMIAQAKQQDPQIEWKVGEVEKLPFASGSFDGITCTNAIHLFKDLRSAMKEAWRILSSGRITIFCSTQEQMRHYWLNHYFPKMMERSIQQMPSQQTVLDSLHSADFKSIEMENFFVSPSLQDLFLYSGKQRPELYLEENFRKNISTFVLFAEPTELNQGLAALQSDIKTGHVLKIQNLFESKIGDNLLVIGQKL